MILLGDLNKLQAFILICFVLCLLHETTNYSQELAHFALEWPCVPVITERACLQPNSPPTAVFTWLHSARALWSTQLVARE